MIGVFENGVYPEMVHFYWKTIANPGIWGGTVFSDKLIHILNMDGPYKN